MIWVETTIQKNKILFGAYVTDPQINLSADERNSFLDGLHSIFETIFDKIRHPYVVLLGDFNDRCNTWGRDHQISEMKFDFVNLPNNFHLSQLIKEPTRNNSILDLIITNFPRYRPIQNSGVDNPISDLDHCPIYLFRTKRTIKVTNS